MTQWQPGIEYATSPLDDLAIANGCYFDQAAAEKFETRCEKYLRVVDGRYARKPFKLLDFQKIDITRPLLGWKREDGTRRYRKAYISMGKKNGKSALCGALTLDGLLWDGEVSPLACLAGFDRQQAGEIYRDCVRMVKVNPELRKHIRLLESQKKMFYERENGEIRTMSRESEGAEGWKISRLIFDEFHTQKTREMWDTVCYAGLSRQQSLLIMITTSGFDRTSICWEQYQYAKGVGKGEIKDWAFFTKVYEADEHDDWKDEKVWLKANPGLGTILSWDDMRADFREALAMPAKENTFRHYRLNQWTQQANRWLPMDDWNQCKGKVIAEPGATCWGGLDLSKSHDVAAFAMVFPHEDGTYHVKPHFWISEHHFRERETQNRQRFNEWFHAGLVTVCEGAAVNFEMVAEHIIEASQEFDLREVAFDPWYGKVVEQICTNAGVTMVAFAQTMPMMGPVASEVLAKVKSHLIVHDGNPVLSWMANNVATFKSGDAEMMSKKTSPEKIDGMIAFGMALQRCVLQQGEPKADFYEHNAVEIW